MNFNILLYKNVSVIKIISVYLQIYDIAITDYMHII
jgi:hypothetical protein